MSETISNSTIENYKGILQQYCQKRALGNLTYETDQRGTANEPSWIVTVKYGDTTYTTPTPIRGSKRGAEQFAAKQILEQIEGHQEAFIAGHFESQTDQSKSIESTELHQELTEVSTPGPLYVPTELVTTALGIANHRLAGLQRGTRYRDSVESKHSNQAFARNLANLTMQIVREISDAAGASGVKFGDLSQYKSDTFGSAPKERNQ